MAFAWLIRYSFLDFFKLHVRKQKNFVVYVAAASFWMYLVHISFTIGPANLQIHGYLKLFLPLTVIFGFLLIVFR